MAWPQSGGHCRRQLMGTGCCCCLLICASWQICRETAIFPYPAPFQVKRLFSLLGLSLVPG